MFERMTEVFDGLAADYQALRDAARLRKDTNGVYKYTSMRDTAHQIANRSREAEVGDVSYDDLHREFVSLASVRAQQAEVERCMNRPHFAANHLAASLMYEEGAKYIDNQVEAAVAATTASQEFAGA